MATPADVIAQTSSINLISKSISATRSSVSSTSDSVSKIQKIIATKTTIRNELFFKNQTLISRRREASKRRELEDQIEASKVSTNIQSGLRTTSASSQGPLGRILSFLGYMGAGWIIENLPTWIAMGQEFIARMKKAGEIIYSIPNTMWRILQGFGNVLGSTGKNILSLDFTDSSDGIKNSFAELTDTIELLGTQITDGFKLMLQPSGEVDIPSTGEQQPDTGFPDVPPVPSPDGGGGGFGGSGVSKGVEIARRLQKDLGLRDYQAAAVVGNLLQENSTLGPSVLEGGKKGLLTEAMRKGTGYGWAQWTYPSRQKELYQLAESMGVDPSKQPLTDEINYAMLVRELPRYDSGGRFRNSKNIEEASNWILFQYENPADKGSREQSERIADSKKVLQGLSSTSSTPQKPTAPPRPVSTGTMNLIPQTGPGGFIQGGSGSGGDTTYATHFHIDAKTANPNAAQLANIREVSFQAVKAMFARGSWVHFGNIKKNVYSNVSDSELKSLIAAEQRAHGARSSAGVDIQEHNPKTKQTFPSQPGSATKFPFAVGEVYYRGGYGREAEIIGSSGITVSHGAAGSKSSGVSLKPSSISPQTSRVLSERELQSSTLEQQPEIYSLSPEERKQVAEAVESSRRGQEILFIDDRSPTQQPSAPSVSLSSYGGGSSGQITEFDMLNKFMKQKLLLDFNYL
jgi:hypothetical protein